MPAGFKAAYPLTDDPTRYDIALANWRGTIVPGQGITLYFTMNILPTAKVGLPVLGPVTLHFLRPNSRTIFLIELPSQTLQPHAHTNQEHIVGSLYYQVKEKNNGEDL